MQVVSSHEIDLIMKWYLVVQDRENGGQETG